MSEETSIYSGFILKVVKLDVPDLPSIIRVASFKPRSDFRRILPRKAEKSYKFDFGQIIHFSPRSGELEENSLVIIHEDIESLYEHRKEFHTMIIHILKDVSVSAEDLPKAGTYKHPDLGIMKDEESRIKTGMMSQIFIKVLLTKDSFEIEVQEAKPQKHETPLEKVIPELEKFEQIHEIKNCGNEINRKIENKLWRNIGLLKLTDFNKTNIQGYRPVF
ncbi:hypothetical protein CAEBREN_18242 [Caenorhabditis brenneri]|uniref:Uncharacterized protein n=1 Tax=Caenorhabditis brenneri TaxID=135651 RepID=G0P162_CAEBE|nr:hypothetical protein CAEBREN_18242 [Caenorhabditis brenneri]